MKSFLVALALFFTAAAPPASTQTHPNPFILPSIPAAAPSTGPTFPAPAPEPKGLNVKPLQAGPSVQNRPCAPGKVCVQAFRFSAEVDDKSAHAVIGFLQQAQKNHIDVVILELATLGGSYPAGHEIARAIEISPVPVVCVVDGLVASMGVYIFQSCDRRLITPRGMLMLHSALAPTPFNMESEHDLEQKVLRLKVINRAYGSHVIAHTGLTLDQYLAKIANGNEWWLDADEAVKVGFAFKFPGTPNALMKAIREGQTP
jgi:ATP-dependent protease ClpP protease subunit